MTQDQPNRLDRIEEALDRQVAVNADLRTSVTELRASTEALLQIANIHQQNFERLVVEMQADRQQAQADRQQAQADRVEWRAQINRIWEYLLRRSGNGRGGEQQ